MANCKVVQGEPGCGASLVWFKTETGAKMPLDATPERRAILTTGPEGGVIAKIVDVYVPHFISCSVLAAIRERKKAAAQEKV